MSRIIKLKQSDLAKIVEKTLKENIEGMEDTPNDDDFEIDPNMTKSDILIAKGKNDGRYYVIDTKTNEVLGVK